MARGSDIIVAANPLGVFMEGVISGTPSPGTVMEVKSAVALSTTRFTWQAFSGSTGDYCLKAILLPDEYSGSNSTTAYVSGTRCRVYIPLPGEEMNLLFVNASGTANSSIAQKLQVQTTTGYVTPRTSTNVIIAQALEAIAESTAAALTWCHMW